MSINGTFLMYRLQSYSLLLNLILVLGFVITRKGIDTS